ncbi:MAG TPA: NAD-dependent succinate-semialdehyde dehydrogenase [Longimicrobiales bacterium]|nr:NAD-dependent succinate-semialdehyde dehydrogenase [Longimicrobiales bacterium]
MPFNAIDPTTGQTLSTHEFMDAAAALAAADRAHAAHLAWRDTSFTHRRECLEILGGLLRERKDEYGALMTREMGKPLAQAVAEAEKCATAADYYAENAEAFLAPVQAESDATRSYWTYRPLGVVLGIMPWNFPFWQVVRFATPALAAGNAALLKHAPSVPGCGLALEKLYRDAGFPEGLFKNLFVDTDTAGLLIDHPSVKAVSLTGSVRAGKAVAARAGAALKKCVLELGGSDPSVVLADADMDATVSACVYGRLLNTGQSCIAAKRFVVVQDVLEPFTRKLIQHMAAAPMGDPTDPDTILGPMARADLRDELHGQVERSVAAGATLALGGEVPDRPGAWYPATVLTDVKPGMPAYAEELFGPVASVIAAKDTADAIRIANDTRFGLGASVYTRDTGLGERIAAELLDAGNCFVNGIVKSDPRLPFGGVKESGYGRELSPLGILEFTNVKTVWVK